MATSGGRDSGETEVGSIGVVGEDWSLSTTDVQYCRSDEEIQRTEEDS